MVNSAKLTVTKLSRLQKLILSKLRDKPRYQDLLAHEIADEYEGPGKRQITPTLAPHLSHSTNFEPGIGESIILSNVFKASFYRSLRRLRDRGLIWRGGDHWWDDISNIWRHDTAIQLTELGEKVAQGLTGDDGDGGV